MILEQKDGTLCAASLLNGRVRVGDVLWGQLPKDGPCPVLQARTKTTLWLDVEANHLDEAEVDELLGHLQT